MRELAVTGPAPALRAFEEAARRASPDEPVHLRARLLALQALAELEPARVADEFLACAREHPGAVTAAELVEIAGRLAGNRSYAEALELLERAAAEPRLASDATDRLASLLRIEIEASAQMLSKLSAFDCWTDEVPRRR